MRIAVCVLAILFGLLHMIASITRFKSENPVARGSAIMMVLGGAAVIAAAVAHLVMAGGTLIAQAAVLELFVGCALVWFAAWLNGKRSEDFHLPHHIIRGGVAVLLVVGFVIW